MNKIIKEKPKRIEVFNCYKIYNFQFFSSQVLLVTLVQSWKLLTKLYCPWKKPSLGKHIQYMFICTLFHIFLMLILPCRDK